MLKNRFAIALCASALAAALLLSGCAKGAGSAVSSAAAASPDIAASSQAASGGSVSASPAASAADLSTLPAALNCCLGWGGDAGSGLKSMIAACALLDWAEDNSAAQLDSAALQAAVADWAAGLDEEQRGVLEDNWAGVSANGDIMISDPASVADLLDSAGNPNQHSTYTAQNWAAIQAAVAAALAG